MSGGPTRIVDKAGLTPSLKTPCAAVRELSGRDAQVAYATSALAARRLLDEAGGAAVANLLRDLGDGVEFEDRLPAAQSHLVNRGSLGRLRDLAPVGVSQ